MTKEERGAIQEAIELVEQAQALVDGVLEDTGTGVHYMAYGRYGFDQLLGNGNPHDYGLPSLLCDPTL